MNTNTIQAEAMTKNYIERIRTKKLELKIKREMYKNRFDNDDEWKAAEQAYREARLKRAQEKLRILEEPAMKALDAEIHEMAQEVKSEQLALSDWLYAYEQQTGSSMVEMESGETYLVQRNYKVKKESRADKWLRKRRESESKVSLPGMQVAT